jgi:pimeloyl-ACP methyl ester carboxylesterase
MRVDPAPIVLVHGAWHGAWSFAALQAELDRRGLASQAVDLPGHGVSPLPLSDLYGDAAYVADVIRRMPAQPIVVGHSYGGAVISEAASLCPSIEHLVFVAAFALDAGESVTGLLRSLPQEPVKLAQAMRRHDDGTTVLEDPDIIAAALYGNVPQEVAAAAIRRLGPQPMATMTQPLSAQRPASIASTYVCCTADHAVAVGHQRVMAARCGSVIELEADHSPFLSAPRDLADIIEAIARG